jgi:hypothetical protein
VDGFIRDFHLVPRKSEHCCVVSTLSFAGRELNTVSLAMLGEKAPRGCLMQTRLAFGCGLSWLSDRLIIESASAKELAIKAVTESVSRAEALYGQFM